MDTRDKHERNSNEARRKKEKKIVWKTITPRTPHQGGRWERMVRSMKRALEATQNSGPLKEDGFRTVLAEASDMLNSRPLTRNTSVEEGFITPNHFLYGRMTTNTLGMENLNRGYEKIQNTAQEVWKRFIEEILIDNREAAKWTKDKENIEEGDLALIIDPNPLKKEYKIGTVVKIFPGKDGKVRNMDLRTEGGILKRSITNIIPIPKWDDSLNFPPEPKQ